MSMGMTPRQSQLFAFINRFVSEHDGEAPSFDQMTVAIGLKSKSGIHRILSGLESRGAIRRLPNRARAIEVVSGPQFDSSAFFDTLNPTARYVIRAIAMREGTTPELVMREWINDWASELRRNPSEYLSKTQATA